MIDPTEADIGRRVIYHYRRHPFHGWTGTLRRITEPCFVEWDNGRQFHAMRCLLRWES